MMQIPQKCETQTQTQTPKTNSELLAIAKNGGYDFSQGAGEKLVKFLADLGYSVKNPASLAAAYSKSKSKAQIQQPKTMADLLAKLTVEALEKFDYGGPISFAPP